MSIIVTGACGRIGTALLDHQNDQFDYSPFDRQGYQHSNMIKGDIAEYDTVYKSFESMDAVVHLAADSDVSGDWDSVLKNNIIGGYNCLEASRQQRIDTVVLASSNHVVGMYETEHAPDIYHPDYEFMLDHTVPVRPDSFYATSKVFLEALGRYYVENYSYPNHVYALRIGSVRSSEYDNPFGDAERGVDNGKWSRGSEKYNRKVKRMKAMWQSRRDIATLIECCLQDDSVSFEIFYGVSDNKRRWLDIKHAKDIIGYNPTDSADDWDHPSSISPP